MWRNKASKYFLPVIILNIFLGFLEYSLQGASRIDCGTNCAAYIPSTQAVLVLFLAYAFIWVVLPASLYIILKTTPGHALAPNTSPPSLKMSLARYAILFTSSSMV